MVALMAAGILLAPGCATAPPVQEMSDARQAIYAAREAGAQLYAPGPLQDAEGFLDEATRRLDSGDYETARNAALAAKREAMKARDEAVSRSESP